MTGRCNLPGAPCSAEVDTGGTWAPERGDLALDTATGRVGVVVAIPEDTGANVYHLRPPRGGADWVARPGTLQPYLDPADDGLDLRTQPLTTQPVAVLRAEALAAALRERHCIQADVHPLTHGALVSVHHGLVVYSNGADFSWRNPEPRRRGRPLQAVAVWVSTAARRVAEAHQVLVARRQAELLNNPTLRLAGKIRVEHVAPV